MKNARTAATATAACNRKEERKSLNLIFLVKCSLKYSLKLRPGYSFLNIIRITNVGVDEQTFLIIVCASTGISIEIRYPIIPIENQKRR
jgi:hypothetical protein